MINPKELRIGNYVMAKRIATEPAIQICVAGIVGIIVYVNKHTNEAIGCHLLEPIHLTPELLEKCGFKEFGACYTTQNGRIRISVIKEDNGVGISDEIWNNQHVFKHIHYLHQLQNLYYCLTGQELTVNL